MADTGSVGGDVQEIDVLGSGTKSTGADSVTAMRVGKEWRWPRDVLLALAFLMLGLFLGGVVLTGSNRGDGPQAEAAAAPIIQPLASAPPTETPDIVEIESEVRLLAGSTALQGSIGLAPFAPLGKPETVWAIEPGRLISRPDVPLRPGDWPYYLLFTGRHIAFTSPPDAYLLPADLSEPAIAVSPARYIVPGATPGLAWAINEMITAATPIDMDTGQPGDEILLVDDISWVIAAVADGFVVNPKDHDTYGSVAFWAPNKPIEPIELPVPGQTGLYGTAGNSLVIASPGPRISALDVTTGDLRGVLVDIGDGLVSDVCMSPAQRYAVVVGSTVRSVVIDFEREEVLTEISITQEFQAVSWTSDTQLVYIFGDVLFAIDVVSGDRHEIAQVDPETYWRVSGSAAMC